MFLLSLFFLGLATHSLLGETVYLQKSRTLFSAQEFKKETGGQVRISRGVTGKPLESIASFLRCRPLPWDEITVVAKRSGSEIWVGTTRGAVRLTNPCQRHEYFAGKRWLPDDQVRGIGFDPDSMDAWIETAAGYSRIEYREMTLSRKAEMFEERIRNRHVRHGFTADSRLQEAGNLNSNLPVSTDNDGLWTAMYLAAESFRFSVTQDPGARERARTAAEALMWLEEITPIRGFPARSVIRVETETQPADGEWHSTPDRKWKWKGDTSSDEIVGHYYGLALYHDLVANDHEKAQVAGTVDRITNHILDNGYHLIDLDGKPTRWGWWAPDEIWQDPDETGLRALHLLSHLKVAEHLTKDDTLRKRYSQAYTELIAKHRYHLLTLNQKINYPGYVNHSDDELAFLSYYPLLLYEKDAKLREIYQASLERSWQVERPERNPLWNFIYAAGTGAAQFDRENSLRTLEEIPLDLVKWSVSNSHRLDILRDESLDRHDRQQSIEVLPYDELPMMKWNGNPYQLDGGARGLGEDDGAYFLLPYWMGRYYGYLDSSGEK
ncbi:MAG: hypothetical protein JSU96_09630 [Acidobacteriota bacterium]|nr:MAG: hypothetical protein JSU96_09630 [Acidobacteriota bacterium]